MRFGFITDHRHKWPVKLLCRILKVTESGYYKSLRTKPEKHATLSAKIFEIIKADEENVNYGMYRIYLALRNAGYSVSYHTVVRVCHENGLVIRRKRRPNGITHADRTAEKSENLINQDFTAEKPNEKWLTDITEIPCCDGKLYLAPVLDCYDGAIVGLHTDTSRPASLCCKAFENACKKTGASGMILHSDRGSQYTSMEFRDVLKKYHAVQSMSGVGRCYDNARMESFFATLKKEKLYRMDTEKLTVAQVRSVVYRYVWYYNLRRVYTTNDGYPPLIWRQRYYQC